VGSNFPADAARRFLADLVDARDLPAEEWTRFEAR
jgi:hypothetical protein